MMQSVDAALDLKMPPTLLIYSAKQPTDDWDNLDKKLALAAYILNKQTCPKCGQPLWICRSEDPNLDFTVRTATCYATKALEDRREADEKRQKNTKKKPLKNGEFYYVMPKMLFDKELPSRSAWLESMNDD